MSYLKRILICFLGIIISLGFATFDFSGIQYGFILNILGYIGVLGFPIGFIILIII